MAGSDKRKQSLYFPEDMLKEIQDEATRQDRSLSWIVQKAWKIARKEIMKYPAVNECPGEEDEKEIAAKEWDLAYIPLDGTIGCMVNGAGLAMGTMDIVALHGGFPANFLDVGGGATRERVTEAFKIILSDDKVKAVLINIFGGIVRCDLIAEGVIGAVEEIGVNVPVVVRLEGNNAELARKVLADSGLNIIAATSLTDAAQQAVAAAGGAAK